MDEEYRKDLQLWFGLTRAVLRDAAEYSWRLCRQNGKRKMAQLF